MGVSFSSESSAPRELSSATAAATASREGGSGRRPIESAARPGSRRLLVLMTSCSSATRQTSGCVYGASSVSEVKRCAQRPCWTRPARPRRCLAAAAEISTSWSDAMRRATSYRSSLTRPASMTNPTSSIVIDVSATLVASTTLTTWPSAENGAPPPPPCLSSRASRPPALRRGGGRSKTRRCSSGGNPPWSGSTHSRCSSTSKLGGR